MKLGKCSRSRCINIMKKPSAFGRQPWPYQNFQVVILQGGSYSFVTFKKCRFVQFLLDDANLKSVWKFRETVEKEIWFYNFFSILLCTCNPCVKNFYECRISEGTLLCNRSFLFHCIVKLIHKVLNLSIVRNMHQGKL